jgi:transketolase
MKNKPVKLAKKLSSSELDFLSAFAISCRRSILEMTCRAKSGHPGGSLSSLDYIVLLYTKIISHTNDPIIISNGHISPAVYAVLAELGVISKKDVLRNFRASGSIFEGHVSRAVPGIFYSTGPLGTGASAATGFAFAQKLAKQCKKVFVTLGDGESQEGQIYEMMNFAKKYKLDNLIAFLDLNEVQLSGSTKEIMPFDPIKIFTACGWEVIESKGHDFQALWSALNRAYKAQNKPVVIVGHTIMGKGISFMESSGKQQESTWHGNAPSREQVDAVLPELTLPKNYTELLEKFKKQSTSKFHKSEFIRPLSKMQVVTGTPHTYSPDTLTDCRSAYGNALLDLAKLNKNILALTADLSPSVKTDLLKKKFPDRHIDCGIAEQQMISCAGGLSLAGYIPFASTFGAFMTSRAKDQARVNDINETNVKMVATHCGLSVGEDGPTHQAIDDIGSMLGLLHTHIIEPADPNQTNHIIRYIASHYGNFYVRMGRHKIPVLTKTDGTPFFDAHYKYEYGRSDILRTGKDLTLCASGSMVHEAFLAYTSIKKSHPKLSIELVIINSAKQFDDTLLESIQKTRKVLTIEDHNTQSGFGSQLARTLVQNNVATENFVMMGVDAYQMSGTVEALYNNAKISSTHIEKKILEILHKPRKHKVMTFLLA